MWSWTSIGFIPSKPEVIFAQFQEPKAFTQTGRRGSFKSTSKPLVISEFKASGSALYFHWMCFPICKDGHKATLLFESQSPVPAEPCLTELFVFTLFFQNLMPLFLMYPILYSSFQILEKVVLFLRPRSLMCKVPVLKSHNPGTSAVQKTFCQR